jgi:Flp pilus assembly pilin Flp
MWAVAVNCGMRKSEHQGSTAAARSFSQALVACSRLKDERGQDFGEYALVLGLVVLAGSVGIAGFGSTLGTFATNTVSAITAFL